MIIQLKHYCLGYCHIRATPQVNTLRSGFEYAKPRAFRVGESTTRDRASSRSLPPIFGLQAFFVLGRVNILSSTVHAYRSFNICRSRSVHGSVHVGDSIYPYKEQIRLSVTKPKKKFLVIDNHGYYAMYVRISELELCQHGLF